MKLLFVFTLYLYLSLLLTLNVSGQSFYPLDFTENKGQWAGDFHFKAESGNGALFIEKDGYTILQHHPGDYRKLTEHIHGSHAKQSDDRVYRSFEPLHQVLRSHALKVKFIGAANPQIEEGAPKDGFENYFLGDDPSKWKTEVRSYSSLRFKNMYSGVDVKYYSDGGFLKYDLLVSPGADVKRIRIRYQGARSMYIKNGDLILTTSVGEVKELKPYAYQIVNGLKKEVRCTYILTGNDVSFKFLEYDPTSALVIDPILVFSTYTGSKSGNYGFTATPGVDGSFFAGGIVFGGAGGYPVTAGAFQSSFQGGGQSLGVDISITRFNPTGTQRIYSTYLGGNQDEFPHSMFADPAGNLVILGRTGSSNFPVTGTFGTLGNSDIFVAKLNAAGTTLIGSMKIGGSGNDGSNIDDSQYSDCRSLLYNYGDNARSEVLLDAANNIYVATSTRSPNFPLRGAIQNSLEGTQDAVLMKLDPNVSTVLFSTFFGGNGDDAGFVLALDPLTNDIFMAGGTGSSNMPKRTNSYGGDIDGYVAVFSNSGAVHRTTRYYGTSFMDMIYGIQFDEKGFPYIMGVTLGSWPVINATYVNPGSKQFISKVQRDLSGFIYSTVYGFASNLPNISPVAFLVDKCENVYISGWGGPLNPCNADGSCYDTKTSGTSNMPVTPDAIKRNTDGRDFYFFVMEKNASRQLYGSFFGQSGGETDHVDGGTSRFDIKGAIYMSICANCFGNEACDRSPITQPMLITPGVVAPRNGALGSGSGGDCNLAAVKISFDYQGVLSGLQSSIDGVWADSSGCLPLKVDFTDTIANGVKFEWDFGDGSPVVTTTVPDISHVFSRPGLFQVKLTSIDESKCITRDVSYKLVRVRTDKAVPDFTKVKLPPCENLTYRFDNITIAPPGKPFSDTSFIWDFGDNSPRIKTGNRSITHTYRALGTYNVTLILNDTSYCNSPDTLKSIVRISPNVDARFTTPASGCAPYTAVFINTSLAGDTFEWDFGNGQTFRGATPPPQFYALPGVYRVRLIANDPNTCNEKDTAIMQLTVFGNPVARFNFSPIQARENTPTNFTNLSTGAIGYKWFFGDGDSSILKDPVHQFTSTGTFETCLIAISENGCTDTVCTNVDAIVVNVMDVPTAFSPNGDGINDKVYVRGYGIAKMNFRIYNRQGLMVFQSTNPANGWDGKYKGNLQPMDAYAYILDVEYSDGTKTQKKGDITLLR